MGRLKKITVEVPTDVLKRAQKVSGEGVTGTVRRALESFGQLDLGGLGGSVGDFFREAEFAA